MKFINTDSILKGNNNENPKTMRKHNRFLLYKIIIIMKNKVKIRREILRIKIRLEKTREEFEIINAAPTCQTRRNTRIFPKNMNSIFYIKNIFTRLI